MATTQLRAIKDMRYRTRMLRAGEAFEASGPEARLLIAMGSAVQPKAKHRQEPKPETEAPDLTDLRRAYAEKLGKRPFNGWDAAELRRRIADAS